MAVSVFIDGNNLIGTQSQQGWFVDLKKLLAYIEKQYGSIQDAIYYLSKDPQDHNMDGFLNALPQIGLSLVLKPIKVIEAGEDEEKKKGNLDVEIAMDMITMIDMYDCAVLLSGDSDYTCILNLLKARGKRAVVISAKNQISRELRFAAGRHYIDLESLKNEILKPRNDDVNPSCKTLQTTHQPPAVD